MKYFERGRSGRRPHVACEGARERRGLRSDIARAERARARHGQSRHGQARERQQQSAPAAGMRPRSCARVRDKAASGQGPGCACNAAARGQARTSHRRCASSEEERGESQRLLPPPSKNDFAVSMNGEATFALRCPSPAPEGKVPCSRWQVTHRTDAPREERVTCVDAEISILMQRKAEKK